MALWGNKDTKTLTGSGSVTATNESATVTGVGTAFTTELETGNTILITGVPYKVVAIASDTSLTINPVYAGETGSDKAVTANESPAYTPVAELSTVYGVDAAEAKAGGAQLTGIEVVDGGTGYVEAPTVTISGGGGADLATGTASIGGGAVISIALGGTVTSFETIPTVVVDKARLTNPTVAQPNSTFTKAGHGLSAGDTVTYNNGSGASATGLTEIPYYVSSCGLTTSVFRLAATAQLAVATVVVGDVVVTDTAGACSCTAADVAVGDRIKVTGTNTGNATGISTDTIYTVSDVSGGSAGARTAFTLTTEAGVALTTGLGVDPDDDGSTTGLVFTASRVVNITGTGNSTQYFEKSDETTATAVVKKGAGSVDGVTSAVAHVGWVKRKVGTGGRAGRVEYETLVAMGIANDNNDDDTLFPDS